MFDEAKLNQFIGKILGDLGGAFSVPMVRMGDKLGLYKALKEQGPMTPAELAAKTNVAERYAREWLSHQAASGSLAGGRHHCNLSVFVGRRTHPWASLLCVRRSQYPVE